MSRLPEKYTGDTANMFRDSLTDITDERLVEDGELFTQQMPHPVRIRSFVLISPVDLKERKNM
jgi:hypothetical protein